MTTSANTTQLTSAVQTLVAESTTPVTAVAVTMDGLKYLFGVTTGVVSSPTVTT